MSLSEIPHPKKFPSVSFFIYSFSAIKQQQPDLQHCRHSGRRLVEISSFPGVDVLSNLIIIGLDLWNAAPQPAEVLFYFVFPSPS